MNIAIVEAFIAPKEFALNYIELGDKPKELEGYSHQELHYVVQLQLLNNIGK